jgi:PGDYG protein
MFFMANCTEIIPMLPSRIDSGFNLLHFPGTVSAESLPVTVSVSFAKAAGELQTLEGLVAYQSGDAIVTASTGESWPVSFASFNERYRPDDGVVMGADGRYFKRPASVMALRLDQPIKVPVGFAGNLLQGSVGDWLVQYAAGNFGIVRADLFAHTYRILS